eukprot:SAG31_NODE_24177_length_487_cov_1.054124_1_plen_52_part_10
MSCEKAGDMGPCSRPITDSRIERKKVPYEESTRGAAKNMAAVPARLAVMSTF